MMIRDYMMYTYEGGYTYQALVRDDTGETTGYTVDKPTTFKAVVVARSRVMADAWVQERYNASYQGHKDFGFRLVDTQPAPYLLIEYTG